jgi:hypothetical protein
VASRLHCSATVSTLPADFTLEELLALFGVPEFLVFCYKPVNSAATITTWSQANGRDSQARQFLDRMAIDFAKMVKRNDLDFFAREQLRRIQSEAQWLETIGSPSSANCPAITRRVQR